MSNIFNLLNQTRRIEDYVRTYLSAEQVRIEDRAILASHMNGRGQPYRTREAREWATTINDGEIGEGEQHCGRSGDMEDGSPSTIPLPMCIRMFGPLYGLGPRASHLLPLP